MAIPQVAWMQHIASQPECNFTVTQQPLRASYTHPGLSYCVFDRDGNIDVFRLLSFIADMRFFPEYYSYTDQENKWFQWDGVLHDRTLVTSSLQVALSRNIHNYQVPKWPLQAEVTLGYVGKSSLSISLAVYGSISPEPLLTHLIQFVSIDTETRKPMPFPDWFMNKYTKQCSMEAGFRVETFPRPAKTFMQRREQKWEQVQHMNCGLSNSGSQESVVPVPQITKSRGGLREGMRDMIRDGLKVLNICYVNECHEGDIIDVHVWQEDSEACTVRCSIEKGSQLLCQLRLEYFAPLAKL
ncbi:unnamed protein product [Candidula unifasciata]|uniref:Uncharacterized protein n=1 Tax=Candidula unifasciata TaxID=100452 RepID=A0A8S3ZTY8_9EUPU|nr:unnamed protein product [Candidula unifasciata]